MALAEQYNVRETKLSVKREAGGWDSGPVEFTSSRERGA